ncbi:MAG: putative replicase [Cressdnaviricota sp.]|nr:MAG: putative replicase [Cressdnaviricota sp.]
MFKEFHILEHSINKEITTPCAFFIAIRYSSEEYPQFQQFLQYLKKISDENKVGKTTIGCETSKVSHAETNGEHIHIYTHMLEKTYHTLTQTLFKKWGLRGRAQPGLPRQYGKIKKKIRSIEKIYAYTIKQRICYSNIAEIDLKKYLDISYVVEEKDVEMGKMLLETFNEQSPSIDDVAIHVIAYHRKNKLKCPTYSYIKNLYLNFRFHAQVADVYPFSPEDIWFLMKN